MSNGRRLLAPPRCSERQLKESRDRAIEDFRKERMEEPRDDYVEAFDARVGTFERLLETTVDLTTLGRHAIELLTDPDFLEATRYLSGPPISTDDWKVLAEVPSLAPSRLRANRDHAKRLIETVMLGLDTRRFPWIADDRPPDDDEKRAAILASAALIATQRVGTKRRNIGKREQENRVEELLVRLRFRHVARRHVRALEDAPAPGEFCRESILGRAEKADFIVRLLDRRVLAVECKVSNSALNSIKRLNDAMGKADKWRRDLGETWMVPAAVLSGVFHVPNLINAQDRGLTLFWAHGLAQLARWIRKCR